MLCCVKSKTTSILYNSKNKSFENNGIISDFHHSLLEIGRLPIDIHNAHIATKSWLILYLYLFSHVHCYKYSIILLSCMSVHDLWFQIVVEIFRILTKEIIQNVNSLRWLMSVKIFFIITSEMLLHTSAMLWFSVFGCQDLSSLQMFPFHPQHYVPW